MKNKFEFESKIQKNEIGTIKKNEEVEVKNIYIH